MRQSAVMFQAEGLNFEGVVTQPDDGASPVPGVLICHPGPMGGGNMDNNVVMAVTVALAKHGIASMRFNFRGVGNSQGQHSRGELEHQEAVAAMAFLKAWPGVDGEKLGLAGYSFGNRVILGSAELQKEPKVFALISPSLEALEGACLKSDERPKFLITGDQDRLAGNSQFQPVLDTFSSPPTCKIVSGADHYWVGREDELSEDVSQFLAANLKGVTSVTPR